MTSTEVRKNYKIYLSEGEAKLIKDLAASQGVGFSEYLRGFIQDIGFLKKSSLKKARLEMIREVWKNNYLN